MTTTNPTRPAPWTPGDGEPLAELALMVVTVRDLTREYPWGHGMTNPRTSALTIPRLCLRCLHGGVRTRRGQPQGRNSSDDGARFWVQTWTNPCGHTDLYEDVVTEATGLKAARGPGFWVRDIPTPPVLSVEVERQSAGQRLAAGVIPHTLDENWVRDAHQLIVNKRSEHVREFPIYTTRQLTMLTSLDPFPIAYRWQPAPQTDGVVN